ncbi:MAG: hypothetical protein WCI54_09195 [Bacteroidia bacterium]
MDDYIFLIIAIALSIFGAINQNKKKKSMDDPAQQGARPRNFFLDQLLGEDFLAEPKVEIQPKVLVKPVLKKEPLVMPVPAVKSGLYHTSFVSTLPERAKKPLQPSTRKSLVEAVKPDPEEEDAPGYLEDFSLRKAFVYSEIMQRKY